MGLGMLRDCGAGRWCRGLRHPKSSLGDVQPSIGVQAQQKMRQKQG